MFLAIVASASLALGQNMQVSGTVVGQDGAPISGVTVTIKGTTGGGAITGNDGRYAINAPQNGVLSFAFVGMETQEVAIEGQTEINISMRMAATYIDDLVVVAYGTATRQAFTGSAGTVKSSELVKKQNSDVLKSLSGEMAGVQITNSTGQPGAATTVRIRGIGSISASNSPLYVVDGVPFDGTIASINPSDIESISVLKDAAASAIYGARGANGVVIITTKKGGTRDAVVRFDARVGVNQKAIPSYDVMKDPAMFYETYYQGKYNSKIFNGSSAAEAHKYANSTLIKGEQGLGYQVYAVPDGEFFIGSNGKLNPKATLGYSDGTNFFIPDDWDDIIFGNNQIRQEYNLSVSGSTGKANIYASGGYLKDEGLVPNSGFTRYTARLNADYQAKKWLKLVANVGYTNYDSQYPGDQTAWNSSGNMFRAYEMAPIYPLYVRNASDHQIAKDANGITIYDTGNSTKSLRDLYNPFISYELDKYHEYTDVFTSKWMVLVDIYKGLQLNANVGVNASNTRASYLYNAFYGSAASVDGAVDVFHDRDLGVNQQYLLTYKYSKNKHSFDILTGFERYDYKNQFLEGYSQKLYDPNVGELNNAIYDKPTAKSFTDTYITQGFLTRIQYDYASKYYLSGSYRRDASSRFAPGQQWGNFGSISGAWVINNEQFFKNANAGWVDLLKLKVSYGIQGNDNLLYTSGYTNYYPYADQYVVKNNGQGEYSVELDYKGNRDITWETSYEANVGVEFSFFGNRLNGAIDYFNRKTTNLLYYVPAAPSIGYSSMPYNMGSMRNAGVEFTLDGTIISSKNLTWRANFNITHFKNKILSLDAIAANGVVRSSTIKMTVGGSMYDLFMVEWAGVDPNTGEGLYYRADDKGNYLLDANGNKTTSADYADKKNVNPVMLGSSLPDVYGGFGTSLEFFGVDISASFSYQLGGRMYDFAYQQIMHGGDQTTNWHKDILNAWTPNNRNTNVPRLDSSADTYQKFSSRFLISSNYLSLNNVTVGYTLPEKWTSAMKIGSIRIYAAGDNLALITARKGVDPRQSIAAASYDSAGAFRYSAIRTISGGLTVTF